MKKVLVTAFLAFSLAGCEALDPIHLGQSYFHRQYQGACQPGGMLYGSGNCNAR